MRFVFFVEGDTEELVLEEWLGRWLNPQLSVPVKIEVFSLGGNRRFLKEIVGRGRKVLGERGNKDIVACVGLLDLYRFRAFPKDVQSVEDRYVWAQKSVEDSVERSRFHMYFAVHEFEAWLLSQSDIFDPTLRSDIEKLGDRPEAVDFQNPPARRLDTFYMGKLKRKYVKTLDGNRLFGRLDPEKARRKCPYLRSMLDDLLQMAKDAGL
jgi:hypothetical protein